MRRVEYLVLVTFDGPVDEGDPRPLRAQADDIMDGLEAWIIDTPGAWLVPLWARELDLADPVTAPERDQAEGAVAAVRSGTG